MMVFLHGDPKQALVIHTDCGTPINTRVKTSVSQKPSFFEIYDSFPSKQSVKGGLFLNDTSMQNLFFPVNHPEIAWPGSPTICAQMVKMQPRMAKTDCL